MGLAIAAAALGSGPTARASAPAPQPAVHPPAYVPLLHHAAGSTPNVSAGVNPKDTVFNNMDYNGGPVMPSNTDYMVLWSPGGRDAYPPGYISGVERWFKDLAHDSGGNQNTDSVSAQYQDLTGAFASYATTFGGVLVDRQPYPLSQCPANSPVTNCLTDAQIQVELERFVAARGLRKDLSHEYFLMTPPHVETCFSNDSSASFGGCSAGEVPASLGAFCAYHQNTGISPFLIYANDPYVPGNPGCDDGNHPNGFWDGELSGGLSHEQNESVSDPIPNDAWTNGAGPNQGSEVGDQCVGQMGTPLGTHNGAKYNQVINGHLYWYQGEWSNLGHACLLRLGAVGTMPTATFEVTRGSGLTLNFDATGSAAPGGVAEYVWQFNDAFGAQTVEQTIPTISHTFPSAGAYSIGLTVFASDGLSSGTGGIVVTGRNGVSRGFTFSPSHPDRGQTATFSGLFTTMSAQPVLVYLWQFGDGSTGSGVSPTHRYAKPGTYAVTLVMFSGVGSAFPGAGAGPIVTRTITVRS
jgi:PKD repeat protein